MRLIDADALVKELSDKYIVPVDEATRGVAAFMGIQTRQAINNAPTIEAEPVKHGRWIKTDFYFEKCSNCGDLGLRGFRYCPNCGAKMQILARSFKKDEVEE